MTLQFRNAEPPPPWKLDAKRSVAEKPSIWRAVSRSFYERMPGYSDKLVGFSVSPVVVVSRAFETTPTFGIVGSF